MYKRYLFCVVCLIPFLLFIGCSKETEEEQTEMNVAEVTRSVFYTPLYAAIEKGFFEEEGLDIDLQTTWGGDKTMTSLLAGHSDIALVGAETSIYVYAQDSKDYAVNFAQLTQTDGTFLVAKDAHDSFAWEDVKDQSFLGQREGGMPQMVGEYVLKQHGIDPHTEVDLSQNIDFANIPGAFLSGDYEFVQLFEPTASMFEEEGTGQIVASFGEESGKVPYTVFMAQQSYLDEHADHIEQFTRAIYRAQKWVEETDSTEIADVVSPFFEDTDVDLLAASIDRYKEQESFAPNPIFQEDGWETLKDIMEEADELPADIPFDELVNNTFAEDIVAEEGE